VYPTSQLSPRDVPRSCAGNHAPSCFNLAVLFKKGDDGVPPDAEQFDRYSARTKELAKVFGGIGGQKTA
jgi:cytochrome c oxidase assembly factor 7